MVNNYFNLRYGYLEFGFWEIFNGWSRMVRLRRLDLSFRFGFDVIETGMSGFYCDVWVN